MRRHVFGITFLILGVALLILFPVLALYSRDASATAIKQPIVQPSPTPTSSSTPIPTPSPILTVQGAAPSINAAAVYLVDNETGNVLDDVNGEKPLPMASTTKIMTALIALSSGNLNQPIPVKQDAYDRVVLDGGSSAGLVVGDTLPLRDMLYALLLPSGDDAAVAIADALGGTEANFVQRMNLFAYRLHLFQTHYANSDGLTLDNSPHHTTANDLLRLAQDAMHIPLFAQIVSTPTYSVTANTLHGGYTWSTTNNLLLTYSGMIGIKTGHTDAAGWCLVFDAKHADQNLIGVILGSASQGLRDQDVQQLLDWGFALPLLPPES
jgi:serine-type D-Ala-D-Ala carboxypeptidase (penicillin-binding protein 5/6)